MCYSTAFWARVDKIYYAAAWVSNAIRPNLFRFFPNVIYRVQEDYDDLFSDLEINEDLRKDMSQQKLKPRCMLRGEAQKVWEEFRKMPDGARY